jgi:hypothetical protein
MVMSAKGPKFGPRKEDTKDRPRTEADVIARSAENISRGKIKTGRPAGPEPSKNIGVSLPVRLIDALDELAAERTGRNRSLALVEVLEGRLKLPSRQI